MRLLTLPGVFRPHSDTRLLAEALWEQVRPDATVLDLFTGSGALAVEAARAGAAQVSAIDVSRRAVVSAWLNARLNGASIRVLHGDMLAPVAGETFDLIVANPPYLPGSGRLPSRGSARAWEGGRDGRALLDRLLAEAPGHLRAEGVLLFVQSSVCGLDRTLDRLREHRMHGRVVARHRGPLGPLLRARASGLEARKLLQPGQIEEELQVFEATAGA